MSLWKVTIRDGRFGRIAGMAIAWADDPESAAHAVERVHEGETSYGQPFAVGEAEPYKPDAPKVIVITYGEEPPEPG